MKALLILTVLLTPAIGEAKSDYNRGLVQPSCELTLKSALRDLRGFCEAQPYNEQRLVDFRFQMDLLVDCDQDEAAKQIQLALDAKIHRKDERTCVQIAEREVAAQAAAPAAK